MLFPSLAALGTPYPAAAAQGWGELGCGANAVPKIQESWVACPSGSPAGITDEVSSKRPAQPVAGRGCVFPLDGDKRLRVPSEPPGTPGSPSASLGAAERDTPPASSVAPGTSRGAFGMSSSQVQAGGEKFHVWLVQASAAKNCLQQTPGGAQRRGNQLEKQ